MEKNQSTGSTSIFHTLKPQILLELSLFWSGNFLKYSKSTILKRKLQESTSFDRLKVLKMCLFLYETATCY